jgi:hypothetical protein
VDFVYDRLVTEDNQHPQAQRKTLEELRRQAEEEVGQARFRLGR